MEIIRKNELQEILDLVKMIPHGKFLITGAVGSGKTFLLNIAGKMLWEQGKKIRYKTMELFPDNKKTGDYLSESSDTVYLIDGLDDIYRYKQIVKEIEFGKACYICTSRENQFATKFDYEIKLEPLTTEQTFLFINDYLGNHASNEYFVESIIKELDHQCLVPRLIAGKIHDRLKDEGFGDYFLDIESDIHQLYTYNDGISLQYPEIIVPECKIVRVPDKLKQDIKVVTHSLMNQVASNPKILHEITPRQFEELVCELFEKEGNHVELTKQTRDGGKDLIILNNSSLGDFVIYAECKKRAPKYPVNVGFVRELYGTVNADNATAGIMVTTSYFSRDARKYQEKIKSRMSLIDYSELMKRIMACK